jgi:hypothetical protein
MDLLMRMLRPGNCLPGKANWKDEELLVNKLFDVVTNAG